MVEVQPGRPVIFRATPPRMALGRLVEDYGYAGDEAVRLLELDQGPRREDETGHVWLVNGRRAVARRLAG